LHGRDGHIIEANWVRQYEKLCFGVGRPMGRTRQKKRKAKIMWEKGGNKETQEEETNRGTQEEEAGSAGYEKGCNVTAEYHH
jgi:hypothetical protein